MKLIFKSSLFFIVITLLSGCASTLKSYPGKMLSQAESGVLTCDHNLEVKSIDGNESYRAASAGGLWFRDCAISMTPGKHTVTFRYYSGGTVSISTGYVTHEINVEKGQIYRIKYASEGRKWKPWIEQLKGEELEEQRRRIAVKFMEEKAYTPKEQHKQNEQARQNDKPKQNVEKSTLDDLKKNTPPLVAVKPVNKLTIGKNTQVGIIVKASGYEFSESEKYARKLEIRDNFKKAFTLYSPDKPRYVEVNNTGLVRSLRFEGEDGKVSNKICKEKNVNYLISGIMDDEPFNGFFSADVALYSCDKKRKIYESISSQGFKMPAEMDKAINNILMKYFITTK